MWREGWLERLGKIEESVESVHVSSSMGSAGIRLSGMCRRCLFVGLDQMKGRICIILLEGLKKSSGAVDTDL